MSFQKLNKCLREITKNNPDDEGLNTRELHEKYNLDPINVRLWRRAKTCWEKLEEIKPEICERSREISQDDGRRFPDHRWWQRMYESQSDEDEPEPLYVLPRPNRPNKNYNNIDSGNTDVDSGDE